jgi:hypothetical protein
VTGAGGAARFDPGLLVAMVAVLHAACAPLSATPQGPPETLAVLEGVEYRTGPGWGTPWLTAVASATAVSSGRICRRALIPTTRAW